MKKIFITMLVLLSMATAQAQTQGVYARTSVQGYGRNRADAKEQAMKNAVWAVIFDGIREGVEGCNMRPLVTEVNARERYEDYFNIFFADNGAYKEYVSLRDTKKRSAGKEKDKVGYSYDLTIRVLRAQLKARLKADNVIE